MVSADAGALSSLFMPFVWAINGVTNGLLKLFGFRPDAQEGEALSQEELRTIVAESGTLIPGRHRRMLTNILDLEQVTVDDIMVPRNEVYGLDLEDSDEEILEIQQALLAALDSLKADFDRAVE